MKLLFISEYGNTYGLAAKVNDKHDIYFYSPASFETNPEITIVPRWQQHLAQVDGVVLDAPLFYKAGERAAEMGKTVLGGHVLEVANTKLTLPHSGIYIQTSGWFNGKEWVLPFIHFFPLTGAEMGIEAFVATDVDNLVKTLLLPLTNRLKVKTFRGLVSSSGLADETTCTPVCAYTHLDPYVLAVWGEILPIPYSTFIENLFETNTLFYKPRSNFALALRATPSFHPPEEAKPHIYFGPEYVIISARGRDMREATRRVYRTLKNAPQGTSFRTGAGRDFNSNFEKLQDWGWVY